MEPNWNPLYDKLIVRRHKPKSTYDDDGKIKVAETHQQQQNKGVVLAVGGGRIGGGGLIVEVGMEVLFGQHGGVDLDEGEDLVMLREDELLAYRRPQE